MNHAVLAIIAAHACIPPEQISGNDELGHDLRLDSLDRLELAMRLEEEFGIEISDDEVDDPRLRYVGALSNLVDGKLQAKREKAWLDAHPSERVYADVEGAMRAARGFPALSDLELPERPPVDWRLRIGALLFILVLALVAIRLG